MAGSRPRSLAETAVSYYLSRFVGHRVKHLFCTFCGELHLDSGYFAVHPHRRHLCHACARYFHDDGRGVSNPIAYVRELRGDAEANRELIRPDRPLDIRQVDYPGGVQVWASNPALLWTSPKPEEEGVHVHLFSESNSEPVQDETFSIVTIDGIELDQLMVQYLMAQRVLPHLKNKLVAVACPSCGRAHFDQGAPAFNPHKEHDCEHCGTRFSTVGNRRLIVSNPLVSRLKLFVRTHRSAVRVMSRWAKLDERQVAAMLDWLNGIRSNDA
jgi:hypothetical protein